VLGDKCPVVAQHVVLVDGDVGLTGVEVGMAEQFRGEVHRQPAGDCVGGEDAAEVVRGAVQWLPVGTSELCAMDGEFEQPVRSARAHGAQRGAKQR
jgi:hypothetical protein